ncbi:glycoside hydrolase superfamily [Pseudomassariella vexata]|uniref:Beta-xylanase n=1 Tax=Pseudomassariella vexata TaxID=1141098 RepID=A0A1Y2D8K6_9PEZI|nr:glycoside hydrolase superfamily [Pseudomassariella vexata]ORY54955.1 glycoside hydrolase superfamily [Pseudomassariella vexata]
MFTRMRLANTAAAALVALPYASAQLNDLAKAAGLKYLGSALDNSELTDTAYTAILSDVSEVGQITPGNTQKWQYIEPSQGTFDFTKGDVIVDFAETNSQVMRCHTLVWYSQLPSWVSSTTWTAAEMTSIINVHIANEVGHYKGQCYAWDVVNEALDDSAAFRDNVFYEVLGEEYITLAFKAAAEADPDAKLYYNDYNIESTGAKQEATVSIIKNITAAGARVDGVGMQGHFIVDSMPSVESIQAAMQSYMDAGVTEVAFTELDVKFSSVPASADGLEDQAAAYATVVGACLAQSGCIGITLWGFSDKYSWVPTTFPGEGEACLYDDTLSKKPAWTAVSSVLAAAATGSAGSTTSAAPASETSLPAAAISVSAASSQALSSSVAVSSQPPATISAAAAVTMSSTEAAVPTTTSAPASMARPKCSKTRKAKRAISPL